MGHSAKGAKTYLMKILIDTNVALTYVSGREDPFSDDVDEIMLMCAREEIKGAMAFHSLSTIWYQARKLPDETRREWIKQLCELLTITGADNVSVLLAVKNTDSKDFEDALQVCCAETFQADYIVTANISDFRGHSEIPALTPREFLSMWRSL